MPPDVTIKDIALVLARQKWWPISMMLLFGTFSFGVSLFVPEKFQASILISPVSNSPGGQLGTLNALTSQLGGIASLAALGAPTDSKKAESTAALQSEELTERFIQNNNLLPVLFSELWDEHRGHWRTTNTKKIPTLWDGNQFFKKDVRSVSTDVKTGLVTMSITWTDATSAAAWANRLVNMTNLELRDKAIAETERNIAYLNDQAAKTSVIEARQAIYAILQTELNKAMLAKGNLEYAFRVIDPAFVPEKRHSPKKITWLISGLATGLILGTTIVFTRWAWKSS